MTIEDVARICHEANRAYCETLGDDTQKPWAEADEWQRHSAVRGVRFSLGNPLATAKDQHDAWCAGKFAEGWQHGQTKDAVAKTHPCLVPYDELPGEQRAKDHLFNGIVGALRGFVTQ